MCLRHQAVELGTGQGAVMLCSWEGNACLAESNGSLPPSGWLIVTCGLTACTLGSAPGPTLSNEYGKPLPLAFLPSVSQTSVLSRCGMTMKNCLWHVKYCFSNFQQLWECKRQEAGWVWVYLGVSRLDVASKSSNCWRQVRNLRFKNCYPLHLTLVLRTQTETALSY